jgi:hypothetical protein
VVAERNAVSFEFRTQVIRRSGGAIRDLSGSAVLQKMREDGVAKESADIEEMLGRKDPYEFWLQEAAIHAGPLDHTSPNEILSVVQNAFGKEWLDEKVKEREKASAINSSRHPLARMILVPGETQVRAMFELGIYLKDLAMVPRLNDVIRQLKNKDDFENTLVQLAYGYRLLKIGAAEISFEPDVDDGRKADILFKFEGQKYLAECFKPDGNGDWYSELGENAQKRIFEHVQHANKKIFFLSTIRNDPSFTMDVRKEFEADWRKLIGDLDQSHPQSISKANYDIEIQEISALSAKEKEDLFQKQFNEKYVRFVYKQAMMPKSDALNTMRGAGGERETRDMLFFRIVEEEPSQEKMVNELAKKMEKKVAQLRQKGTETKGILIVASPVVHPRNVKSKDPFERLQGKVVEAHEHVEAATIVHKTTGPKGDPRFGGYIFQSKREGMKTGLLDSLEKFEAKGPLLK